jgi:hypothetical protein
MPRRTNVMSLPFKGTPAGGGYSTASDLQAFAAALRDHKLLGGAMTETVTSAKVDMDRPGMRYGYGFVTRTVNGREVRGHSGGAPGINAQLSIFWDGSYTVAVMGNYDPPAASALTDEIVDFLAAQTARQGIRAPRHRRAADRSAVRPDAGKLGRHRRCRRCRSVQARDCSSSYGQWTRRPARIGFGPNGANLQGSPERNVTSRSRLAHWPVDRQVTTMHLLARGTCSPGGSTLRRR